jgi:hypothetical protein
VPAAPVLWQLALIFGLRLWLALLASLTLIIGNRQIDRGEAMHALTGIAQTAYYIAAIVGILSAAYGYRRAKRLEAARWALQLWEKFYEKETFKSIRAVLDCDGGQESEANRLVENQSPDFTDYLNFFEFIAYLKKKNQLSDSDIDVLFSYYLGCLKERTKVYEYIRDPRSGYEELARLLADRN